MSNFLLGYLFGGITTVVYFYWCDELHTWVKGLFNKDDLESSNPSENEG